MNLEDAERDLRAKLNALHPAVRGTLLRDLMLPDHDGAGEIKAYRERRSRRSPRCGGRERDHCTRAVVLGMLWEEQSRG